MGEKCLPDELRTLFLFEALTDEQLQVLCDNGHIATYEPGPIHTEGDPATCFYVLIDGELVMSKRSGGVDIETNRTSQRGVYCGAWSAYIPGEEHVYQASVRVTRPSRFFVLDAHAFAEFMQKEFPMAVHLLEGHMVGGLRQRQILGQREKLLALGQLSAGL
ncbi:MAG: cyclic nucleotide-binding domain-containing protein, partial [Mycobacterium sp.]|nr:cyclic nucleotide-binding domain-containing protein [Mycobacterium sp.]